MNNALPFVREAQATLKPASPNAQDHAYLKYGEPEIAGSTERTKTSRAELATATDLHNFLEKNARQLGTEIRMLEQQRQHLRAIEKQRSFIYEELSSAIDALRKSSKVLDDALAVSGSAAGVEVQFDGNRHALERLETVTVSLVTNFQIWRTAWEQYATTCGRTRDLKAEMAAAEPLTDA